MRRGGVRRQPISKSCEITQAIILIIDADCLGRLNDSKIEVGKVIKIFSSVKTYIDKISSPLLEDVQIAREAPRYLYAASGWSRATSNSHTN